MMDVVSAWLAQVHTVFFETVVLPALGVLGLRAYMEDAFDFTEWFLIGVVEVTLLAAVLLPIERWRPAERGAPIGAGDRVRVDLTYTLLHRLGAFAVFVFALMQPMVLALKDTLRDWGWSGFNLDAALA